MPEGQGFLHHSATAGWQLRGGQALTVQSVTEMHAHPTSSHSCSQLSSLNFPIYLEVTESTGD